MRMYPALVNCTTIDLFNEWPQEALLEVGEKYLMSVNLDNDEQVFYCCFFFHSLKTHGFQNSFTTVSIKLKKMKQKIYNQVNQMDENKFWFFLAKKIDFFSFLLENA
jgi:hypothetical protein